MPSIKLSVTVRAHLQRKYKPEALKAIDQAIKAWIAADAARDIKTVHVAVDDSSRMKALGVKAVKGKATAGKIKRAVDALWKRLAPDYLVLFGGDDIVPHFSVANPSFDPAGDDDERVPTDNPYASSSLFSASKRSSYLVPDRVIGRIPDMLEDGDSRWFVDYLTTATAWKVGHAKTYKDIYTICCDSWKKAGIACAEHLGRLKSAVLVAPPEGDTSSMATKRLGSRLHMIKCHGAKLDPQFYGQKGNSYPLALSSPTLRKRLKPKTLVAAMCCYGAQVYSPNDSAAQLPGEWPLASTYLRKGAPAFAGATMIAWVGVDEMMCADWIVAGYLKGLLAGASTGRALLESKQDYVRWINQQGQVPDLSDEKTLIEFVLLGDPSVHPVAVSAVVPAVAVRARSAAVPASAFAVQERRQRRVARRQMAEQIRQLLPVRSSPGSAAHARAAQVFQAARAMLPKDNKTFGIQPKAARVEKVETKLPAAAVPAGVRLSGRAIARPPNRQSLEYYWSGRRVVKGHKEIRLIKVETDAQSNVVRTSVVHSS